jgi:hypothetical protein
MAYSLFRYGLDFILLFSLELFLHATALGLCRSLLKNQNFKFSGR